MKIHYTKKTDRRFRKVMATQSTSSVVLRNLIATLLFGVILIVFTFANQTLSFQNVLYIAGILLIYFAVMATIDLFVRRKFKK